MEIDGTFVHLSLIIAFKASIEVLLKAEVIIRLSSHSCTLQRTEEQKEQDIFICLHFFSKTHNKS